MSSGSSGGTTSTTTSSVPSQYLDAYSNVVSQAQSVASQPLTQYSGNTVAGFSPDQLSAMQTIDNSQGIANPYINAAAQEVGNSTTDLQQYIQPYAQSAMGQYGAANGINSAAQAYTQAGGTPLTAQDIATYESPYTQSVVNATQNEFNNQNAIQQQGVVGNAISQGAYGGDRSAVAQGITAGQQALAQAPTIAGLYNTGYTQAVSTAEQQKQAELSAGQGLTGETQAANQTGSGISGVGSQVLGAGEANNWLASQAGYSLANLGNEALSTTLTGANAQYAAGTAQQSQAQTELNVPYEQYVAQEAYPFQTTSWLANIAEGIGSSSGGTSSTTSNSGNTASSVVGAGLTGLGLLGSSGAFGSSGSSSSSGSSGWLSSLFSTSDTGAGTVSGISSAVDSALGYAARGGAIPHRATGGGLLNDPTVSAFGSSGLKGVPDQSNNGTFGNSSGAFNTSVGGGAVPDISISIVPGASGLTAHSGSGSSPITKMTDTTQTNSGGSGGSSGISLGTITSAGSALGSLFSLLARGGHVPRRAIGGGLSFPMHHASSGIPRTSGMSRIPSGIPRIPGQQAMRLASGGGTMTVNIPGTGGVNAGSGGYTTGGNGVTIPLLGGSGSGSSGSGNTISGINDYLAGQKATAATISPTSPSGAGIYNASHPSTSSGSTSSGTSTYVPPVATDSQGGSNETGGNAGGGTANSIGADIASMGGMNTGGPSGGAQNQSSGGGFGGGSMEISSGGSGSADEAAGGASDPNGGMYRRGGIVRRPDGGGLPDWAISDRPSANDAPDVGLTADNSSSWQSADNPAMSGANGDTPIFSMPDTGQGSATAIPTAPEAPSAPADTTQGGQGIAAAPSAPSAPSQPTRPEHGGQHGSSPWDMLTATGLAIMSGTSTNALQNIGRGGMKGLEFAQNQRKQQATDELNRIREEDLNTYRQQMAVTAGVKAQTGQQRAGTYEESTQGRIAHQALQDQVAAGRLTQAQADSSWKEDVARQNAAAHTTSAAASVTRAGTAQQSMQALGQYRQWLMSNGNASQAEKEARRQDAIARGASDQDTRILTSNPGMTPGVAHQQGQAIRDANPVQRPSVTTSGGSDGLVNGQVYTDKNGNRAMWQNGQWNELH